MKGQYVIVDALTMEFFRDKNEKVRFFDNEEHAIEICKNYEFENAWVMQLVHDYTE
jgi:hypothetical protein